MAEVARQALESRLPPAPFGAGYDNGPVVADVRVDRGLGFVLLLHRRDDGYIAEEVYHSLSSPRADGAPESEWLDCDHLNGGLLGFDATNSTSCQKVLAGQLLAIGWESESLLFTGRPAGDEGYELVRIVELLVTEEADLLEIGSTAAPSLLYHPLRSPLALVVLLPGDQVAVRPARTTDSGPVPIGDALMFSHPAHPATDNGWW